MNDCSQIWKATKRNGNIIFSSSCGKSQVLDVRDALAIGETPIQICELWGKSNKAQEWVLEEVP